MSGSEGGASLAAQGDQRPDHRHLRQGYKDNRDCEHAVDVIKKGAEKAKVEEAK
jgi:hypothetical protein